MLTKARIKDGRISLSYLPLKDGEYLIKIEPLNPKTEEEWRKYYFLLRDILYEEGETGYTKQQLHTINKAHQKLDSTKELTLEGWQFFVKEFKILAQEKFNCYL